MPARGAWRGRGRRNAGAANSHVLPFGDRRALKARAATVSYIKMLSILRVDDSRGPHYNRIVAALGDMLIFSFALGLKRGPQQREKLRMSAHMQAVRAVVSGIALLLTACSAWGYTLDLGPEKLVKVGGVARDFGAYSVPCPTDWNNDGATDLLVGLSDGKVVLSLNAGTDAVPNFQSPTTVMTVPGASGCLGSFPRVCDWNQDGKKDIIAGSGGGSIYSYINAGSDNAPSFGSPSLVVTAGSRACIDIMDWNGDGKKDLLAGELGGYVRVYTNNNTNAVPVFSGYDYAANAGSGFDLLIPSGRSSPCFADVTGDGLVDLICGNTDGQVLLYENVAANPGTPSFGSYTAIMSGGVAIDISGSARSRPAICDFNGDGGLDLIVGSSDGYVRIYEGAPVPEPASMLLAACGTLLLKRRR